MNDEYRRWALELTNLPTAAGREDRVIAWVERYVASRRGVILERDRFGNLTLRRAGVRASAKPLYFTAHMDHPAFVVHHVEPAPFGVSSGGQAGGPSGGRGGSLVAEFRGSVDRDYFAGAAVLLHHGDQPARRGTVRGFVDAPPGIETKGPYGAPKFLAIDFKRPVRAGRGDVLTWDVGPSRVKGDRLYAPACDDTAGVAAAIAAFDVLLKANTPGDYRVLLTRAEEMAFIGAIAACKARALPRRARLVCLENSKSYAESPLGAGPIVRVGDYTSTFDPDLTYRMSSIAADLAKRNKKFNWQRKLMPGGTCEASAFQSYGYTATCLCLPLGNYHNMAPSGTPGTPGSSPGSSAPAPAPGRGKKKVGPEYISLTDYDNLIRLLVAIGKTLDAPAKAPPLRVRLDQLFKARRRVLHG